MHTSTLLSRLPWLWAVALVLVGCVEPYMPEIITSPPNYLVVEGFINSQGVTTLTLSRSFGISAKTTPPIESGATAYIEEEGGLRIPLLETVVKGTYASASTILNSARRYRLHLTTRGGQEYASEYVPVKTTPLIDNLTWRANSTGLSVFVNSHDDASNTQYYRWEYDETWEIASPYDPKLEYVNGNIRPITIPFPRVCYANSHSSSIEIFKTTALTQDVVANYTVRVIPPTSPLVLRRYSILVQQHALTRQEYEYWDLLRKNTEKIGSLFDPQPAQLTGNVRCISNPTQLALGYVGVHSITEKRILIGRSQLPNDWRPLTGYESCIPPDTVRSNELQAAFGRGLQLPIDVASTPTGAVVGYLAATPDCIDCRKRGTAIKPSYWP